MGATFTDDAKAVMLDALAAQAVFASLHSAFPGTLGASELVGGLPPYARQAMTWNPAAGGNLDSLATPTFNVPALSTVAFAGFWTAVVAGTFLGWMPFGGQGLFEFSFDTEDTGDGAAEAGIFCPAHGLIVDDTIFVVDSGNGTLPTGLIEGVIYTVATVPDTDVFTLNVAPSADGVGYFSKITTQFFALPGTLTLSDADFDLNL